MANYPNMNPMMVPPPPPPPPPKPMDADKHSATMAGVSDSYDDESKKMGLPMEGFAGVPPVPTFVPQPPSAPPPPPMPVVPQMAVPQPMVMAPALAMIQNMNFQTGQMNRQLIDPYLAAEISSIVHTLSTSQLVYVLAALKKFLKHAPSEARRFLINNPQLTYALLHTQFILGEHDETVLPLSKVDHDISQVNKLERSMHLKPFHNLYEDASVQMEPYPPEAYATVQNYVPQEQPMPQQPPMGSFDKPPYRDDATHQKKAGTSQSVTQEATQSDIEELMNQGIYPASAALVDEVIKNSEILTNIQKATLPEMSSWPAEQKQQVLSIKIALHMRGIAVNL